MVHRSTLEKEIGPSARHVCVDMQRLFGEGSPWELPWMPRTTAQIVRLCERSPERTIFTRFIPARHPGDGHGRWRQYYLKWAELTLDQAGAELVELIPELRRFAPPALVLDKPVYSPWLATPLATTLRDDGVETIIVTGGETDMCVLSTVLGAVDFGFRVVVAADGVCSVSDSAHEHMLELFARRFSQHVEVAGVEEILDAWQFA